MQIETERYVSNRNCYYDSGSSMLRIETGVPLPQSFRDGLQFVQGEEGKS